MGGTTLHNLSVSLEILGASLITISEQQQQRSAQVAFFEVDLEKQVPGTMAARFALRNEKPKRECATGRANELHSATQTRASATTQPHATLAECGSSKNNHTTNGEPQ